MKNSPMNVKVYVGYRKGVDYDAGAVRPGPKGGTAPEFKCFSCGTWFDGNEWNYSFSKTWYPFLKYQNNFLCGAKCSSELSEKHKDKMIRI